MLKVGQSRNSRQDFTRRVHQVIGARRGAPKSAWHHVRAGAPRLKPGADCDSFGQRKFVQGKMKQRGADWAPRTILSLILSRPIPGMAIADPFAGSAIQCEVKV
jgi:hypothetical protein